MSILGIALAILGLAVFETVSSIDNAIINAEVLSGMGDRARRWFLVWGLLFAVFAVRGLLPWLIVWLALPAQGPLGAFVAAFSSDTLVMEAIEQAAPVLLMGGGVFLVLLFLHWLFLEPKQFGLGAERFFTSMGAWFFAVAAVFLALTVWFSLHVRNMVAFSGVVGSTLFFITQGFKENAEAREKQLLRKPFGPEQDPLPRDHRHDVLHRRRARRVRFHHVGPDHRPGQRGGGDHRAPDHGGQHREDPAAPPHQERGNVLDPLPGSRHDVRWPRRASAAVGVTRSHHCDRRRIRCDVAPGASK